MEGFLIIIITAFVAGGAGVWFGYGRGCVVGVESVQLGYESVILEHTQKKKLRVSDKALLLFGFDWVLHFVWGRPSKQFRVK